MFKKFKKDRQLVDIVRTESGVYITANFKDYDSPTSPSFYREAFTIKGHENFFNTTHSLSKKNPKYELKCRFDSEFGIDFIPNLPLKEYILKLKEIIKENIKTHKKLLKENNNNNTEIYNYVRDLYYTKTFHKIIRKTAKNSLDIDFFPIEILMNEGEGHLSVIGPGMQNFGGYSSARVDLYELTKVMPRKKIITMSTYIAKKINSGFISRISSDSDFSRKIINDMEKEGRCIKVQGFPAIITFDSELYNIDPIILEMRKLKENKK